MNRRGFLAMLAGLPFVAKAMVATEQRVMDVEKKLEAYAIQCFRTTMQPVIWFSNYLDPNAWAESKMIFGGNAGSIPAR